jgi:hypothetical protein
MTQPVIVHSLETVIAALVSGGGSGIIRGCHSNSACSIEGSKMCPSDSQVSPQEIQQNGRAGPKQMAWFMKDATNGQGDLGSTCTILIPGMNMETFDGG